MKQIKTLDLRFMIAVVLLSFSTIGLAAQPDSKATDQPAVVSAVAPVYHPIALVKGVKGEVVIEVTIDLKGNVVSASVISGNEYLAPSGKEAAMKWQFAAGSEGEKTRVTRLTFVYGFAAAGAPIREKPEITTVFKPPYRVELIIEPYVIH